MSGGGNLLPKFMPISLSGVYHIFEVFQAPGVPTRKSKCILECYPVLSLHGLKLCKFVSRSYLVLISCWMLTMPWIFYSISFYSRASRFVAFQTKVAQFCFCLVRIKCRCSYVWGRLSLLEVREETPNLGGGSLGASKRI